MIEVIKVFFFINIFLNRPKLAIKSFYDLLLLMTRVVSHSVNQFAMYRSRYRENDLLFILFQMYM